MSETVTLTPQAAEATQRLADHMGVTTPEAVRRGLILLDLLLSLPVHEQLTVHNTRTGQIDRIHLNWDRDTEEVGE